MGPSVLDADRHPGALGDRVRRTGCIVGSIAIAVNGVIDQGDEISSALTAGLERVGSWLDSLDIDICVADARRAQAKQFGLDLIPGLASW